MKPTPYPNDGDLPALLEWAYHEVSGLYSPDVPEFFERLATHPLITRYVSNREDAAYDEALRADNP